NTPTPAPQLTTVKVATESSYSAPGDVIHYTITVTNSGNVSLGGKSTSVTSTDVPNSDPIAAGNKTGPFTIAAGAHITCSASHTIVQPAIDAASSYNQAPAHDAPRSLPTRRSSDLNTPTPAPQLTTVKVATESSYSAPGDVIHYTITVTNSGNVS